MAAADAVAEGAAIGSPGFLSGHVVQVPVPIPVNLRGNAVNIVGVLSLFFIFRHDAELPESPSSCPV
ncbi:chaplin family protein [Streptomyces sp. NPDC054849]